MKIKIILAFILILSTATYAFSLTSANYKLSGVISDGGGYIENMTEGKKAYIAIGQPLISSTGGTDEVKTYLYYQSPDKTREYKLCLGVFCTGIFDAPHSVSVNGKLKYDSQEPVANADAIIKIKYGLGSFESSTKTDDEGVFSGNVSIPESIATKNFKIEVYIKGRVEASYTCIYDQTSHTCH